MLIGKRYLAKLLLAFVLVGLMAGVPAKVWAQAVAPQAVSPSYSIDEAYFGTGGQLCEPGTTGYSTNYCATSSVGETVIGSSAASGGSQNQVQGGQNTYREEYIEMVLNNTTECGGGATSSLNYDMGILSSGTTSTYVTYFSVKSYMTSSGYVVRSMGAAPTSGGGTPHTLATPNDGSTSNPAGTERFGINLVDNSSPNIGVNPDQKPDSSFSTGQAASGYNTTNVFRYVNGDIIANSNGKSSGTTCYAISYLYNIANATPAGNYIFNQSLVATSTY